MQPEKGDTETAVAPDIRSHDDRDRAAISAWMRWQGVLYQVPGDARRLLHHARCDTGKPLHRDGKVTKIGRDTIAAAKIMAHVMGVDI